MRRAALLPLAMICACHAAVSPVAPAGDPAPPAGGPAPPDLAAAADLAEAADLQPVADLAQPSAADCVHALLPATATALEADYDQFAPTMDVSCAGTHHQGKMTGIQKVVFLGDSITAGTPPSLPQDFYTTKLYDALVQQLGPLDVQVCAQWGATTLDLLAGGMLQIPHCFPTGVEPKKTLVVMTIGGNNLQDWALAHPSVTDAIASIDVAMTQLREAIAWLKDPAHFPAGSYVVFANAYEYTDGTGDLDACLTASVIGLSGSVAPLWPAIVRFEEQLMKVAVDTGTDLVLLYEHFCGHGYENDDPAAPCYRGPGAERWFDVSCVHPTPLGHSQIAQLFLDVIRQ